MTVLGSVAQSSALLYKKKLLLRQVHPCPNIEVFTPLFSSIHHVTADDTSFLRYKTTLIDMKLQTFQTSILPPLSLCIQLKNI
jgi:hypothetical protein